MSTPRLLTRERRPLGVALATVALAQALLAAVFADAISVLAGQSGQDAPSAIFVAASLAGMTGIVMLADRWAAERFAQSFVLDCRIALFSGVIRHRGEGRDSRWLTALVGDLTAIRNYAVRGSVKLWTSLIGFAAASAWLFFASPGARLALLPLFAGLLAIPLCLLVLNRRIALQRSARGRLNRFLIRRVRIEMAAAPCPRGHGQQRMETLSRDLRGHVEQRALLFGVMEMLAVVAGACGAILLVAGQQAAAPTAILVGQISLIGFIASRLLETARALHARAGGLIALQRLSNLLARVPGADRPSRRLTQPDFE